MAEICIEIPTYTKKSGSSVRAHQRCYETDPLTESEKERLKDLKDKIENRVQKTEFEAIKKEAREAFSNVVSLDKYEQYRTEMSIQLENLGNARAKAKAFTQETGKVYGVYTDEINSIESKINKIRQKSREESSSIFDKIVKDLRSKRDSGELSESDYKEKFMEAFDYYN